MIHPTVRSAAIVLVLLASACARPPRPLVLSPAPRLVVVAPHPDDETIAAGGLIQRVLSRGGSVWVVVMTNGDAYRDAAAALTGDPTPDPQDYRKLGARRVVEGIAATRALGVPASAVTFLGYPDGGLEVLWTRDDPYVSPYTHQGPFRGREVRERLRSVLAEAQPTLLVIPDPRDVHPDHARTGCFATEAALSLAEPPAVLSYVVHDPLWPPALGERPDMPPPGGRRYATTRWTTLVLTPGELATKRAALANERSQVRVLGSLLTRFLRPNEVFGELAPETLRGLVRR